MLGLKSNHVSKRALVWTLCLLHYYLVLFFKANDFQRGTFTIWHTALQLVLSIAIKRKRLYVQDGWGVCLNHDTWLSGKLIYSDIYSHVFVNVSCSICFIPCLNVHFRGGYIQSDAPYSKRNQLACMHHCNSGVHVTTRTLFLSLVPVGWL